MLNRFLRKLSKIKKRIKNKYKEFLFKKYTKKALIPFDENWFRGKRVAIVGGADSVFNEKLGEYIDSFDVVVRINKGVEIIEQHKEYVGTKTDVLFHCLFEGPPERGGSPITLDLWKDKNVKKIIFSHNLFFNGYGAHLKHFLYRTKGGKKMSQLSMKAINESFYVITPYHPTTGFIAINTIFNCMPREIYITGITFFKTPHQKDYRITSNNTWNELFKNGTSKHNPEAEYQFVKKLSLENKDVIKPDAVLKNIFETN